MGLFANGAIGIPMSKPEPVPCPFCGGKRRFGVGRAPCLCTLGTGEPRGAVVIRIPQQKIGRGRAAKHWRPTCRADCANVPRPCPFAGCLWNTYLQVRDDGSIKVTAPHRNLWDVPPDESCVLDLADRGGMTLEQVAIVLNCTRERVRQVEFAAWATLRDELRKRGCD
jgi:hypothetical protein